MTNVFHLGKRKKQSHICLPSLGDMTVSVYDILGILNESTPLFFMCACLLLKALQVFFSTQLQQFSRGLLTSSSPHRQHSLISSPPPPHQPHSQSTVYPALFFFFYITVKRHFRGCLKRRGRTMKLNLRALFSTPQIECHSVVEPITADEDDDTDQMIGGRG